MKKLFNKLSASFIRGKIAAENFVSDQRGDTNFISIAIILIVVIVIAIVFIGFGQTIAAAFEEKIEELKDALGI